MNTSLASLSPAAARPARQPAQWTNIAELLLRAARRYPRTGICTVTTEQDGKAVLLTYPALLDEACRILNGLRALQRPAGTKVVLLLERHRDCIPAFWACVLGGYVPCLLAPIRNDPDRWAKHLSHVDSLLDHPLLVATATLMQELPRDVYATDLNTLRSNSPVEASYEAGLEDAAMLVLTSGSTGNAKAVVLTHGNVLASMAAKTQCQQLTDADVTLNWISFDHIAALSEAHLLPLYVGAMQLHVEPAAILADPLLFLRLLDRYRVSMTFTPNFLLGQINASLQSRAAGGAEQVSLSLDLSCVRHIVCGGEAIVVDTARRFLSLLEPYGLARGALWPAFGMTETCAGCVYSREFPGGEDSIDFASLGLPVNGLQMRIMDDNGALAAAGEAGELQLRGPMVFGRYLNNEAATRAAFTADAWFRTGDLGRIDNGRLSLVGRSKDSIIVSGINYFSHELETVLQSLEGIEQAFVAAFPTRPTGADTEQLVIAFATSFTMDDAAKLHQLVIAVRNTTILLWGFRPAAILPLPKAAFPKTSLGKIQRAILRQRLEAGEFAAHQAHIASVTNHQLGGYTPPEGVAETAITNIYAQMFGLDPGTVSATASFFDLGGTSLEILKLKQLLEQRLHLTNLPVIKILQNPTARALARTDKVEYDPIVALQNSGDKTPLFCVHPGIGEVLVFVNLAKYFVNDRPFLALRARGFNPGESHFATFEEMVNTYVAAIRRRQPHGPYAVSGYSYGGVVAFEIARLLEAQGERVAFVGSIDMPPHVKQAMESVDAVESAVLLAFFLSLIDRKQVEELPSQLRAAQATQDPCTFLFQLAAPERLAELDLDLAKFVAWAALTHNMALIGRSYVPSGTVESVVAFHANPLRGNKQQWLHEVRRWDEFTRAPVRYIEVTGEHYTLLNKHAASFQGVLRAELDRALDGR